MQGRDLTLQWMSYGSQAALLRFLQAALCLAHHCGKADKAGVTAAAYAGRGMAALTESGAGRVHLLSCETTCMASFG